MTKFDSLFEDFGNALRRLEEILKEPKTDIVRDSSIKRFELVFDLGWKTLKAFVEKYHNATCASPRSCFREAFRLELIDFDDYWIKLTDLRNYSVHTYKEKFAEKIYKDLPKALEAFKKLLRALESKKD